MFTEESGGWKHSGGGGDDTDDDEASKSKKIIIHAEANSLGRRAWIDQITRNELSRTEAYVPYRKRA
jgi:hypothetical protein